VSYGRRPARLLLGRDITERARLQQRLIAADRMASIGILAAGVAHEVNNPLAYVLNNIELAMKFLAPLGEPTAESRAVLGVALEGVDRIRVIVRDLLMLTRSDEREVLEDVDVRAVVESTMALAAREIEEHARLVCEYEVVPLVRGTSARLGQVLLNLLGNALEAMAGRPKEANELRLAVRRAAGGGAVVEVSDNGVGIPPENASRVFDPFFTTKAQGRGTGLGLSISQRLIAEIGGDLTFVSTPERGSTFRVTLAPAAAEPAS
jgi:signal transduction histidine kinase